jgi:putative glycosyltransferase (TIGR04372 family)
MKELNPEKVRKAFALVRDVLHLRDPEALIGAARALRQIGRPDEAQKALERAASERDTDEWRMEYALTLATRGYPEETLALLRELVAGHPQAPAQFRLILAFADIPGVVAVGKSNVRSLMSENITSDDPAAMLIKFPLKAVGLVRTGPIIDAVSGLPSQARLRLVFQLLRLKARYYFTDLLARCLIGATRIAAGGRPVHIASMGEFTRLADVVDRVDPVLRRLRDESHQGQIPVLMALYYGGYPNEELFFMYAAHCRMIPLRGNIQKRLGMMAFRAIQRVDRHYELTVDYREIKKDFATRSPLLKFSDSRACELDRELEKVDIDPAKPIICFGLRDMAYYQFYGEVMRVELSSVQRGDTWHRCPPLASYLETAGYWAERGYQVVRMGLRVTDALPKDRHPKIIDYAVGNRSDALDAYLFSRCRFLLAGDTGLFSGSAAFDRPAVVSDLFLVRNAIYSSNKTTPSIYIPKLAFDRQENRFLTFSEWIYFNHLFSLAADCENARFELVHNEPGDIIHATVELSERLEGRYEETAEERLLQLRFRKIYSPYQVGFQSTALVSADFLRKHASLLD